MIVIIILEYNCNFMSIIDNIIKICYKKEGIIYEGFLKIHDPFRDFNVCQEKSKWLYD